MKNVILTGATGFIGRQAIEPLLKKGFNIHAVSSRKPPIDLYADKVNWHQANLLNKAEVKDLCRKVRASHLLHFAWYVEHGKFWEAPENKLWLEAGIDLIRQFKESGGERVVASGTCAEYEWGRDEVLAENASVLAPQTLYGKSKLSLYRYIQDSGLDQAWGRVFFVFGEYEHPNRLVSSVVRSLLKNRFADCSHGKQIRDFLYVRDAADAFVELLDSNLRGAVNIASGKAQTIKDMVLRIADLVGKRDLVRFGKLPGNDSDPLSIVAATDRLNKELEWKEKYGVASGLHNALNYWKYYENTN